MCINSSVIPRERHKLVLFLACGTVESSTVDFDILYTFVCAFDDRKRLYILKKGFRSKGKSVNYI